MAVLNCNHPGFLEQQNSPDRITPPEGQLSTVWGYAWNTPPEGEFIPTRRIKIGRITPFSLEQTSSSLLLSPVCPLNLNSVSSLEVDLCHRAWVFVTKLVMNG